MFMIFCEEEVRNLSKINKSVITAFVVFVFLLCACSCGRQSGVTIIPNNEVKPDTGTEPMNSTPVPTAAPEEPTPTVIPVKPKELVPLAYYSLNGTTYEKELNKAMVSGKTDATPDFVLSLFVSSLEEIDIDVSLNATKAEGDTFFIDVQGTSGYLNGADEELETAILDAAAQSILDNFSECAKIVFLIDDGAYKSGNFDFTIDHVYMERKN